MNCLLLRYDFVYVNGFYVYVISGDVVTVHSSPCSNLKRPRFCDFELMRLVVWHNEWNIWYSINTFTESFFQIVQHFFEGWILLFFGKDCLCNVGVFVWFFQKWFLSSGFLIFDCLWNVQKCVGFGDVWSLVWRHDWCTCSSWVIFSFFEPKITFLQTGMLSQSTDFLGVCFLIDLDEY